MSIAKAPVLKAPFPYFGGKSRVAAGVETVNDADGLVANSKKHANPNARRERIWFSPHCLKARETEGLDLWP